MADDNVALLETLSKTCAVGDFEEDHERVEKRPVMHR